MTDVEALARRLEPIMPGKVRGWMKVHAAGDPEMRAIIERQIRATAQRVLGDARRVLLSLPPQRAIGGAFNLGTVVYDRDRWPAGLQSGELLQGVGIFGRSGGGKTNAVFHLLLQLADRSIPFLFLDWKRTGRHLLPLLGQGLNVYTPGRSISPFPFNPFIPPPGYEQSAYAGLVADQLAVAYTLGDGAVGLLQKAINAVYVRNGGSCSLPELIAEVEQAKAPGRVRGWQTSALRALRSLEFATPSTAHSATGSAGSEPEAKSSPLDSVAHTPAPNQRQLVQTLLHESSIVELDALPQGAKRFLIPLVCLWVYHARLAASDREKLRLVIVLEEAHHVLYAHPRGTHESVMEMLLRQCRELGIAVLVVDQHPHLISSAALGNTYTTVCFNLKDPADVRRAAAMTLVDDPGCLGTLPVGQAVVRMSDRWRRPFVVRFPLVHVPKGTVTDAILGRWVAERSARAAGSAGLAAGFGTLDELWGRVRRVPSLLRPLLPDEIRFVEDVVVHPLDGVKARYARLGLSGHMGNGVQKRLLREGWLEAEVVPVARTRKLVLRPTRTAREHLGLPKALAQNEGIEHEYWKRHWAHRLEAEGYAVRVESPRPGGAPGAADVVGTRGSESVAIEIETGKADAVANVRHGLEAGYGRIVVVATGRTAQAAVEAALARAGLLVAPRVEVVLAWAPGPPSPPESA